MYTDDGVHCKTCNRWFHFNCIPETKEQVKEMEGDYICKEHNSSPSEADERNPKRTSRKTQKNENESHANDRIEQIKEKLGKMK